MLSEVKVVKREIKKAAGKSKEKMKSGLVENKFFGVLLLVIFKLVSEIVTSEFEVGPCFLQFLEPCANNSIQFFMFTSNKPRAAPVLLDNIAPLLLGYNDTVDTNYKMIIHGYGGHLDFNGSRQIRNGKSSSSLLIHRIVFCKFAVSFLTSTKPAFLATPRRDTHLQATRDNKLLAMTHPTL